MGHDEGDRVLKKFAAELTDAVDPARAFRVGGDESAVAAVEGDERGLEASLRELSGRAEVAKFSFGLASPSEDQRASA
jgi:GGDEF domain-containing protein